VRALNSPRSTLEQNRAQGSVSKEGYREGIREYKKEIEKYREEAETALKPER
jgi:hypothetical protein